MAHTINRKPLGPDLRLNGFLVGVTVFVAVPLTFALQFGLWPTTSAGWAILPTLAFVGLLGLGACSLAANWLRSRVEHPVARLVAGVCVGLTVMVGLVVLGWWLNHLGAFVWLAKQFTFH